MHQLNPCLHTEECKEFLGYTRNITTICEGRYQSKTNLKTHLLGGSVVPEDLDVHVTCEVHEGEAGLVIEVDHGRE